jgi:hypothetical protein
VFRRSEVARGRFRIPEGAFSLGFIGSRGSDADGARKGLDTLTRVLIGASAVIPSLYVTLVGPGWKGFAKELRENGITVQALGYIPRPDLPLLFSCLDTYLMTSRVEGGPCTVLEAMACEVPVVATRVGVVPEALREGYGGYSFEVDEVSGMIDALGRLACNPALRCELGRRARVAVENHWTWREGLSGLGTAYLALAGSEGATNGSNRLSSWMSSPEVFNPALSAGDSLHWAASQLRSGEWSLAEALSMLRATLQNSSAIDVLRGICLFAGFALRTGTLEARSRRCMPETSGDSPNAI